MVKITKSDKQFRITLPKEILELKKWHEGIELIFIPLIKEPNEELNEKTPLLIREARGKK